MVRLATLFSLLATPLWSDVPVVLGDNWVEVRIPSTLTPNNDEVIGPLVSKGMTPAQIAWLKPTYGAQNIAILKEPAAAGSARVEGLVAAGYDALSPDETEGPCAWRGAGYSTEAFTQRIYAMGSDTFARTVLFWGPEAARHEGQLKTLLAALTEQCLSP